VLLGQASRQQLITKCTREGYVDGTRFVHVSNLGASEAEFSPAKAVAMNGYALPCGHLLVQFLDHHRVLRW
jgi:hypothetical protein